MRKVVFKIEAEDLQSFMTGESIEVKGRDSAGIPWTMALRPNIEGETQELDVEVEESPSWAILIGGHVIGHANHDDPAEAVREVFAEAGLSSLPEAVEVLARRDDEGEAQVIFTLDGKAYSVPQGQFLAEVAKSDRWIQAQQAKRTEIDALMDEIKKLSL